MEITSRTELITVMIPTYRSPPAFCSMALYMICTELLVMDMVKPLMPRPAIRSTRSRSSLNAARLSRKMVRFPVKKRTIHSAESSWDKMVARAAP